MSIPLMKVKNAGNEGTKSSPDVSSSPINLLAPWLEAVDVIVQRHLLVQQSRGDDRFDIGPIMIPNDELERGVVRVPTGYPQWLDTRQQAPCIVEPLPPLTGLLADVANRFGLTDFDILTLVLGMMPIMEPRYGPMLAYVQGDDQALWPHVDLILLLFGSSRDYAQQRIRLTAADQPLLYGGLMHLSERSGRTSERGDALYLRTSDTVAGYLTTGMVSLPKELVDICEWLPIGVSSLLDLSDGWRATGERLFNFCYPQTKLATPVVLLEGGAGGETLLAHVALRANRRALSLDLAGLPDDSGDAWSVVRAALHVTRLSGSLLVLRSLETFEQKHSTLLRRLDTRLREHGQPVVALTASGANGPGLRELPRLPMTLPLRAVEDDVALICGELLERDWLDERATSQQGLTELLKRTRVNLDTLRYALDEAKWHAQQRNRGGIVANEDVYAALRGRAQQQFGPLAQRLEPRRGLSDLVVGDALREQLGEILAAIRHRENVLDRGFSAKVAYGVGISALFYGDSGTGKSMAAEAIAYELGLDLIRVDLSTVVNKYVGETEKNLSKIFDLAFADTGVLFFDEADALFGKRSEVKDAKDRHANIEVSYLLQRLEQYPGLVVLSTNNRGHLDGAFTRRLTFMARFELPDAALRAKMWELIWPTQMERATDIDWAELGRRVELTGAGIRNVALLASWLAAETGRAVTMDDIERAVRRELSKTGRLMAR